jgi:outer membrane protein
MKKGYKMASLHFDLNFDASKIPSISALFTQYDAGSGDSTGLGLSLDNRMLAGLDIAVFFGPNVAAELSLTAPRRRTVPSNGRGLRHARPDARGVHRAVPLHRPGELAPDLGVGINHTQLSSVSFDPDAVTLLNPDIERSSTGLVVQAGVDVPLGGGWLVNLDVKKAQVRTGREPRGPEGGHVPDRPGRRSAWAWGLRFLRASRAARGPGARRQGVKAPARPRRPR